MFDFSRFIAQAMSLVIIIFMGTFLINIIKKKEH